MIYITGDTHGNIDIKKLNNKKFTESKNLIKKDYVIIAGDFGCVWDNSAQQKWWLNWLKQRNFTTLFVDGNHENFDLLNQYEVEEWNGGKIHKINNSVIHLMRGQVYNIDGYKIFTMGGAVSVDKEYRKEHISWWKEEEPNYLEYEEALQNLDKNNWNVDYIITHTCSSNLINQFDFLDYKGTSQISDFFNILDEKLQYKHWYFGHFHQDLNIDNKHTMVYNKIHKV